MEISCRIIALMNFYDPEKQSTRFDDLLVADTASECIKCVSNISCLRRSPRETFSIYKLNLVFDHEQEGADFFPFSLKTGVPNEYQLIDTNPVSSKIYLIELSQSYKEAVVLRIIIQEKICCPLDCTYLYDRYYCRDEDGSNVIELKQDGSIQVTCLNPDRKIKFPFGVVAAYIPFKDNRKRLLLSDFKSHSVIEIDEKGLEFNVIVGKYYNQGFDNGPTHGGLLHSPVGIACRGSSVCIAEHPTESSRIHMTVSIFS